MPIQTRPNWTQLTNRPTTVAASGLADAATVTQATQAANPGTVAYFAANTPPAGWLACNGAAVERSTFATIFAAIGTTYGAGDGSTTFNLPDLRGEFLRGLDQGRGADVGRTIGTAQGSQMQSHNHQTGRRVLGGGIESGTQGLGVFSEGGTVESPPTASTGGTTNASENRPRNVAMLACIKF